MKKKRTLLIALLVIGLLVALWSARPRGPRIQSQRPVDPTVIKEELKKFQGAWEFVSLEVEGGPDPGEDFKKQMAVFNGDQWTVYEGSNVAAQCTIKLDPTTDPKSVELIPPPGKGNRMHGIYSIEGGKLTICDRDETKGDRPTAFATEPDSGLVLIVFQKAKVQK